MFIIPTTYTAVDRLTAPKPAERIGTTTLIREHLKRKKLKSIVNSKKSSAWLTKKKELKK